MGPTRSPLLPAEVTTTGTNGRSGGGSVVGGSVVGGSVGVGTVVGSSVVGTSVVGSSVVGASVVGSSVVGGSVSGASVVVVATAAPPPSSFVDSRYTTAPTRPRTTNARAMLKMVCRLTRGGGCSGAIGADVDQQLHDSEVHDGPRLPTSEAPARSFARSPPSTHRHDVAGSCLTPSVQSLRVSELDEPCDDRRADSCRRADGPGAHAAATQDARGDPPQRRAGGVRPRPDRRPPHRDARRARSLRAAAGAGLRSVHHEAPDRLGARLRGAPPRARRVRVEAGDGEGSGGAPGDPVDAVVARRALPHRSRRGGDGQAGRRGPRHRHLDGGARARRRGRPAGDVDRAGHEVRREFPAARPAIEPGDRGRRAVAVGGSDPVARPGRPDDRAAVRAPRAAR